MYNNVLYIYTMALNKDDSKKIFEFFAISKTIAVVIGLYLLHINASVQILSVMLIINIIQLMLLLYTSNEYYLMVFSSLSILEPTNYLLHVIAVLPAYLFSVYFTSRISTLALLLIPLAFYKFGWRTQLSTKYEGG